MQIKHPVIPAAGNSAAGTTDSWLEIIPLPAPPLRPAARRRRGGGKPSLGMTPSDGLKRRPNNP